MREMEEIQARGLLFDMDGVLINSIPAVERVWSRWALEHGFDPEQTVRQAHGRPSIATLRDLLPDADHEAENRVIERCEIEDLEGVVPLPGARELLLALPAGAWGIVTSCTRALAEVRLRAAGLPRPDQFVTSSDVTHGKPHPEPYLAGAARLGLAPQDCLVVEDAPAGIESGKAAGARVIAFQSTAPDPVLWNAGADWIVANCSSMHLKEVDGGLLRLALDAAPAFQRMSTPAEV